MLARPTTVGVPMLVATVLLAACGGSAGGADGAAASDRPSVVVTTAVLGSLVEEVVGDAALDVSVLMEAGADPHTYAPSARDAQRLAAADLVVANGLALEAALLDPLEAAEEDGVEVIHLAEQVDPVPYGVVGHAEEGDEHADDHADEGDEHADDHAEEEEGDDHADDHAGEDDVHAHEGELDPHVWLDPVRVAAMAGVLGEALGELLPEDGAALVVANADEVAQRFTQLDGDIAELLEPIPAERRRVVTNHDSFGYFADRYDLEVVATVLPGATTEAEASAEDVAALVELLADEGAAAILTEASASDRVAATVAGEVDGVVLVEVFSGSLGEPGSAGDTLAGMLRTNAERIADALA